MKHNENSRVKIPALVHLTRLGYEYLSLKDYQGEIHADTNIFVEIFRDSIEIMQAFSEIVAPIHEKIGHCKKEKRELIKLRDWLLPMLMNGQATVE